MTDTTDALTQTIVLELSAVTGVDPLDLPPLYDAVDLDALKTLVEGCDDAEVQFSAVDCDVTVRGPNDVNVTPAGERATATAGADADGESAVQPTFQD